MLVICKIVKFHVSFKKIIRRKRIKDCLLNRMSFNINLINTLIIKSNYYININLINERINLKINQ